MESVRRAKKPRGAGVWLLLLVLWGAVMITSFAVVSTTHDVRAQVNLLEELRRQAGDLRVEWGRYLLEQSTLAAYDRVEKIASEKLQMQVPKSDQIMIVIDDKKDLR